MWFKDAVIGWGKESVIFSIGLIEKHKKNNRKLPNVFSGLHSQPIFLGLDFLNLDLRLSLGVSVQHDMLSMNQLGASGIFARVIVCHQVQ